MRQQEMDLHLTDKAERTKIFTVSLIDMFTVLKTVLMVTFVRACCLHHVANVCMKNKGMNVLVALALPGATCTRLSYYTVDTILYYTLS